MRAITAILLANLPLRWWGPFEERLPLYAMAPAAGLLTMFAGAAIGIRGFLSYLQVATDGVNNALIAAQSDLVQIPGWGLLALPMFLFTTPLGLLSLYLTVGGLARAVSAYLADEVYGDFILTGLDRVVRGASRRTDDYDKRRAREKREGPVAPDRLVCGEQILQPGIELAVLTSRPRPEWEKNTYLVAANGDAYRIGEAFDLETPAGLRTAYPLAKLRGGEAIRHSIAYELPPPWRGRLNPPNE